MKELNEISRYLAAAVQMDCHLGDKEKNMSKALSLIMEAIEKQAKLIVLPELFSTGYKVEDRDQFLAEEIPGDTTEKLQQIASAHDVYISGAIIEKEKFGSALYDTAFLIGPEGLVGIYRKINLWTGEETRFSRGDSLPVFETKLGKIGLQICYEIGFPEGVRALGANGAQVILFPSAFGAKRYYAWDIASRSRALENGMFIVAANRSGEDEGIAFAGNSRIVAPNGDLLSNALDRDQVILAEVNLQQIEEQRNNIPYLADLINITNILSPKNN